MHTASSTTGAQGTGRHSPEFLSLQAAIAGRYSLDRELGRGGMGIVFLARDVALERQVAIKLLPLHLSTDPTVRERFLREARTAAQLMHPNIVPIHSVEEHGTILFFVMAYVDGETLTDRVRRGGCLPADVATQLMLDVAWALGYAHGRGVVHRDIKPDNVLLERASGRALVADFGIARVASHPTLSAEGTLAGTLQYMSPEQASSDALDGRSDLYSLGATMYFALSGSPPIDGPTLPVIITRLLTEPAVPIGTVKPGLPPGLAEAVMRCLAKSADERFSSADALCTALRDALPSEAATPPELRMFLREFAVGRTMPVVGVGIMMLSGAFASIGFLDARGAAVIGILGAALTALFPLSMMSQLRALSAGRIELDELKRGLVREIAHGKAENEARRSGWRAFQAGVFRSMGALFIAAGLGVAAMVLQTRGAFHWSDAAAVPLATSAFVIAGGFGTMWMGSNPGKLPKWLNLEGEPRNLEQWPLRALTWLVGTRLFRAYYGRDERSSRGLQAPSASTIPTATLLLNRVDDLLELLPADLRTRLGAVHEVAESLERSVAALRTRATRLADAMSQVPAGSAAHAEFSAALDETHARITDGVTALENIRTDLLRLGAGLIGANGITAELERAREISTAIDLELAAREEVARLLTRPAV